MRPGLLPLLLLLLVPIAEISAFILVGDAIGLWPTLGLILASMVVGTLLLRHQGFGVLRRIGEETRAGRLPGRELAHGVMIVVAGVLLVLPGFLSDALGLLLFVPAVRDLAWRFLRGRVAVVATSRAGGRGRGRGAGPFAAGRPGAAPDVVDLGEADFSRRPDPNSPWHANGHPALGPGRRGSEDEGGRPAPPPPTLH